MSRLIHDHKLNGLNEAIEITADGPGPGGASHLYKLDLTAGAPESGGQQLTISFQNGPIKEAGYNGFTNEALIAVVIDRLRGFQFCRDPDGNFSKPPGQFACKENACALTHLEESLMWLQKRTRDRLARGVEGKNVV